MAHMLDRSTWWVKTNGGSANPKGDYRCYWKIYYDTDTANRSTKITVKYCVQTWYTDSSESGYYQYSVPSTTSDVLINGKSIGTVSIPSRTIQEGNNGYVYEIDSKSTTIKHNNDGSASFTFQGTGFGKGTAESTYSTTNGNFPEIPSASVMGTISSFTIDDGVTVPVSQYVSSYYEKLEVLYGSTVFKTIKAGKGVSSIAVRFTETELDTIYSTIKTGPSAQFTFRLTTYSDSGYSSKVGNSSTKNAEGTFTTLLPTFSNFGYYDSNAEAIEATGSNQTIIARISDVYVTISAAQLAKANTRKATISHYIINGEKVSSTGGAISYKLGRVTSDTVTIQAVDSRGTASLPVSKTFSKFINYKRVSVDIANWSLTRRDNGVGRLVDISFRGTWSPVNFGNTTNTLTPYVFYRNSDEGFWEGTDMSDFVNGASVGQLESSKIDLSTTGEFKYSGLLMSAEDDFGFDIGSSFDIFVGFQDTFSDNGLTIVVPYGEPAAAVYKNKMSLGGAYDEALGGTQLWGDIYVRGEKHILDVVVYDNESGSNESNIVFNRDITGCEYMEIFYYNNEYDNAYSSVKVYNPINKSINMQTIRPLADDNKMYVIGAIYSCSSTGLTRQKGYGLAISPTSVYGVASDTISITKVVCKIKEE